MRKSLTLIPALLLTLHAVSGNAQPTPPASAPPGATPPPGYGQPPQGYGVPPGQAPTGDPGTAYPAGPPPSYGPPQQGGEYNYPPPPPGYRNAPYGYPPPPPRESDRQYRPVSLTLGFGPGNLAFHDSGNSDSTWGFSYDIRLGIGIARNTQITITAEGLAATWDGDLFHQDAFLLGVQHFVLPRLYLRGAVGLGNIYNRSLNNFDTEDGPALAINGAIGFELLQSNNFALGFELTCTPVFYSQETWTMTGIQFALSFF